MVHVLYVCRLGCPHVGACAFVRAGGRYEPVVQVVTCSKDQTDGQMKRARQWPIRHDMTLEKDSHSKETTAMAERQSKSQFELDELSEYSTVHKLE